MYGDELRRTFSALEWNNILRVFQNEVKAKRYQKMSYKSWRELKELSELMKDWDRVRVYWNDWGYDRYSLLTVYVDCEANDRPNDPFEFDIGDNSFGDFLYELELYREEKKQMKVKEEYCIGYTGKEHCSIEETVMNDEKEKNNMKFNFDFGPVVGNDVRMSLYGLAVKNKSGTYVSYDAKSGNIMDVEVLNFEGAKFLYKMPVAIKDIAIGDIIVHHRVPMFVVAIAVNGGFVTAIDPVAGERKEIMLTKSPFGFDFVTKVVNLLGNMTGTASAENPFGNLGMMMMLSEDGNGVKDMLPLMLMTNGGNFDMSNPLMLYALMGNDGKMSDMLPFMFMMNANKPATHECKCNCTGTEA